MNDAATLEHEVRSLTKQASHLKSTIDKISAQQADGQIGPATTIHDQQRQLVTKLKKVHRMLEAKSKILKRRRAGQATPGASVAHDDSAGLLKHAGTSGETSSRSSNASQESADSDELSSRRKQHGDEGAPAPASVEVDTQSAASDQSSAVSPPAVPATVTQRRAPSPVNTEAPNSNNAPAGQGRSQQAQLRARNRRIIQSLAEGQLAVDDPLYWTIVREGRYLVELHSPDSMCHANCRKNGTQRQNGESTPVTTFFKGTKGLKRHVTSTHKWQGWAGISEAEVVRLGHKRRLSDDEIDAVFHRRHAQFQVEACLPYKGCTCTLHLPPDSN
ncbi:hypothetical protein M409DRAFT_17915 [Zasmidium cellare ATCC 36951]|uniref:Uncharacterized protein n=1 Tax=Zasmidium cellare ATCC 36951 TaxID=1080233 RepID=A0A6A6CZU0_ZASCE|nr:uncharacterized protein M409DRAFT_17915 [Zasmidium cellare ATCC 36951]KAF2171678.1 hypothetical protein M409DRAFT_17915 [Zasmidium cellare ATCC 36951]